MLFNNPHLKNYFTLLTIKLKDLFKVCGPGIIVMLADTDAGSLITAAQSGIQWGYKMILPQLLLIPILYIIQEISTRLGIITSEGYGELIRKYLGKICSFIAIFALLISVIGSLLTEFIGISGIGEMFGISKWFTIPIIILLLILIAFSGSYRRFEHIGIIIGLAELSFFIAIFLVHPHVTTIGKNLFNIPFHNTSYEYLIAANLGAAIMPWMLFYQQRSVIDKKLSLKCIRREKIDIAFGSILTQLVIVGFIILFTATLKYHHKILSLQKVADLANTLIPYLGNNLSKIIISMSVLGGSLVAALVVTLAGSWGISELFHWHNSLNDKISLKNFKFYGIYILIFIVSGFLVLINHNLIDLSIIAEVSNSLLLPIILGFLLLLERNALPKQYRMHGLYRIIATLLCILISAFGIYMIFPILNI